jgi:hypothetical protein
MSKMQNWRVGSLGPVNSGNFSGPGFVLYDEDGKPCVMFGYSSERDAKAGREHIEAALANVGSVTSLG